MTTYAPGRMTSYQVLETRTKGFLVVRSDDELAWKWRPKLHLALRDVDNVHNFWDIEAIIYDCETKERIYHFRSLGS